MLLDLEPVRHAALFQLELSSLLVSQQLLFHSVLPLLALLQKLLDSPLLRLDPLLLFFLLPRPLLVLFLLQLA